MQFVQNCIVTTSRLMGAVALALFGLAASAQVVVVGPTPQVGSSNPATAARGIRIAWPATRGCMRRSGWMLRIYCLLVRRFKLASSGGLEKSRIYRKDAKR